MAVFEALRTDLRDAVRRLRRAPGVAVVVTLSLALALAANVTIYSLLKPTVLDELAVPDAGRLFAISGSDARTGAYSAIPITVLRLLAEDRHSFTHAAAYTSSFVRIDAGAGPFDAGVEGVTAEYFDVLGLRPRAGRLLQRGDEPLGAVAVISGRLSQRMFGDASAVGRSVIIEARPVEIVGVVDGDFAGTRMDGGDDVFLPLAFMRWIQGGDPKAIPRAQQLIGRLAPGIALESVRAEIGGRWPSLRSAAAAEQPAAQQQAITQMQVSVDSFARGFSGMRDAYGRSLTLVMGLAAAVMAVGCINLSAVMLAYGITRRRELAIRIALGAGRARLVQQTALDGMLLALAAWLVSIPLALWASRVLASMLNVARVAPLDNVRPGPPAFAIAAVAAVIVGALIGMLPAYRARGNGVDETLRGRGTAQRIGGPVRAVLVTQVALSMVLVVGAGLFMATLANLSANDVTRRDRPILFTRLARNAANRNRPLPASYFRTLQESAGAIAGADAAAFSLMYPAYLATTTGIAMDAVTIDTTTAPALADWVTPGLFDLYSIGRLRGRDFAWTDDANAPRVAIVNDALAKKLSASADVIGRRARFTSGPSAIDVEIVGVVANAPVASIRERDVPAVFFPILQDARRAQNPMFHLRVSSDDGAARRQYVDQVNHAGEHFVRGLFTMDEWVSHATLDQQLIAGMAAFGGVITMLLSAIGLFGVLAYSVTSRVREIGIRQSIGATRAAVMAMIVREGIAVTLPGVLIGIPLALAAAGLIRSRLYGVAATDPRIIAAAAALFVVVALIASWLPARRASRVDPGAALRDY
jgi:predicted permease